MEKDEGSWSGLAPYSAVLNQYQATGSALMAGRVKPGTVRAEVTARAVMMISAEASWTPGACLIDQAPSALMCGPRICSFVWPTYFPSIVPSLRTKIVVGSPLIP